MFQEALQATGGGERENHSGGMVDTETAPSFDATSNPMNNNSENFRPSSNTLSRLRVVAAAKGDSDDEFEIEEAARRSVPTPLTSTTAAAAAADNPATQPDPSSMQNRSTILKRKSTFQFMKQSFEFRQARALSAKLSLAAVDELLILDDRSIFMTIANVLQIHSRYSVTQGRFSCYNNGWCILTER
jgi:hypothetical protein